MCNGAMAILCHTVVTFRFVSLSLLLLSIGGSQLSGGGEGNEDKNLYVALKESKAHLKQTIII